MWNLLCVNQLEQSSCLGCICCDWFNFVFAGEEDDSLIANWAILPSTVMNYSTPDVVNITGMASQDVYADFLSTVQYYSSADEHTPINQISNRSIQFLIWDEDEDILQAKFTAEATAYLTILPLDDAAVIVTAGDVVFNETTRNPVNLFSTNDVIDDTDDDDLLWISIQLYPPVDSQDRLAVPNIDGLTISREHLLDAPLSTCNPASETYQHQFINISGLASKRVYEDALYNVTFSNDCPGLQKDTRNIIVHLYDGRETGNTSVTVAIAPVDDPPLCYFGLWPVSITLLYTYCIVSVSS